LHVQYNNAVLTGCVRAVPEWNISKTTLAKVLNVEQDRLAALVARSTTCIFSSEFLKFRFLQGAILRPSWYSLIFISACVWQVPPLPTAQYHGGARQVPYLAWAAKFPVCRTS
jgi:hypothetical protein